MYNLVDDYRVVNGTHLSSAEFQEELQREFPEACDDTIIYEKDVLPIVLPIGMLFIMIHQKKD